MTTFDFKDEKWRPLAERLWQMETNDEHPVARFDVFIAETRLPFYGMGSGGNQKTIQAWGEFNEYWSDVFNGVNKLSA